MGIDSGLRLKLGVDGPEGKSKKASRSCTDWQKIDWCNCSGLEPVQDLDQGMQRKAKLDEKAQHTRSM